MTRNLCSAVFVCGFILLAGCESEDGPSARERQDAALRDPFGYNPDGDLMREGKRDEVDPSDISGGRTSEFNKKAMERDLNSVFNP